MKRHEDTIFKGTNPIQTAASATIDVYSPGTTTHVDIFSDEGVTPKSNPTTTDANGRFWFYAPDGYYDIKISGAGLTTTTLEDVFISDDLAVNTNDASHNVAVMDVSSRLNIPVAAPSTPVAGDTWELSDLLKHGVNSSIVADIDREQTFTKAQTVIAPASAGKVALTLKGDTTAAADVLDVFDSAAPPVIQSWFDSTGELNTNLNLKFKSGTANTLTLDHALAANRTVTFPDAGAAASVGYTLTPGTTGSDVNWGATGVLNVPDAGATTRGVVTTGSQTFAGLKTFSTGVSTAALTLTGDLDAPDINRIRYAHQFAGANAGAKIAAAIADLPSTGGTVDARGLEGAQTSSVNPFVGITKPITLLLGDTTLTTSVPWVITTNQQNIIGQGFMQTILAYSGGAANEVLLFDGTGVPNNINFILRNLRVKGNASSTNGITIKNGARFLVENVSVTDVPGVAFNNLFIVAGLFISPAVSGNLAVFSITPATGFKIDTNVTQSADNTIINPMMEGIVGGTGIYDNGACDTYIGGNCEQSGLGFDTGTDNIFMRVYGMLVEGHTTQDIRMRGAVGLFSGVTAQTAIANAFQFTSTSYNNTVLGGTYNRITVDASASNNSFRDVLTQQGITDNGTNTLLDHVYNNAAGYIDDKAPVQTRALIVRSQTAATPTNLTVHAHLTSQGTTDLFRCNDASASKRTWVDSAADMNAMTYRVSDGASGIWHIITSASGLDFVRTGVSRRMTLDTSGNLLPETLGQNLGDATDRWDLFGSVIDIDQTLNTGGSAIIGNTASSVAGIVMNGRAATTTNIFQSTVQGDGNYRFRIYADGMHEFGNGTVVDTNLYRSAADTLKTDDSFVAGGTLAVTGATTLSSTLSYRDLTEVVTATNTITAAESGSVYFLDSATEFDSVLPAPAAGLKFSFVVRTAPSGANYTISTNASSNIIKGQIYTVDVNSATDPGFTTTGVDTINFVDAKAVAGDRVDVICDGTNWFAYGFCSVFDAITFTTAS